MNSPAVIWHFNMPWRFLGHSSSQCHHHSSVPMPASYQSSHMLQWLNLLCWLKKKKERNFMINWGFQNLRFIYSLWKIILRNFNLQCIKSLPEQTLEGIEYTFTSFSLENSLWLCFKIQTIFYIRQRVKRKQIKYQEWYCQ